MTAENLTTDLRYLAAAARRRGQPLLRALDDAKLRAVVNDETYMTPHEHTQGFDWRHLLVLSGLLGQLCRDPGDAVGQREAPLPSAVE